MRARPLLFLLLAVLAGCTAPAQQQQPTGGLSLARVRFADLPDWRRSSAVAPC
jgi:hypothetical protein